MPVLQQLRPSMNERRQIRKEEARKNQANILLGTVDAISRGQDRKQSRLDANFKTEQDNNRFQRSQELSALQSFSTNLNNESKEIYKAGIAHNNNSLVPPVDGKGNSMDDAEFSLWVKPKDFDKNPTTIELRQRMLDNSNNRKDTNKRLSAYFNPEAKKRMDDERIVDELISDRVNKKNAARINYEQEGAEQGRKDALEAFSQRSQVNANLPQESQAAAFNASSKMLQRELAEIGITMTSQEIAKHAHRISTLKQTSSEKLGLSGDPREQERFQNRRNKAIERGNKKNSAASKNLQDLAGKNELPSQAFSGLNAGVWTDRQRVVRDTFDQFTEDSDAPTNTAEFNRRLQALESRGDKEALLKYFNKYREDFAQ